jgi:hypothetical protein
MMSRPTIKSITPGVLVSRWALQDASYDGVFYATHPDYPGNVFVWPYRLEGNALVPTSRIRVHDYVPGDRPGDYLDKAEQATIMAYDVATSRITVPMGPKGIARAVARWIKENI